MAVTYFGFNNDGVAGFAKGPGSFGVVGTCPGTGNQSIKYIGFRGENTSGSDRHFRCAIYNSDGSTLICQTNANKLVSTTLAWCEQTDADITSPPYLTGGTDYLIVVSVDNGVTWRVAASGPTVKSNSTDYTGGFPSSITLGTTEGYPESIRCGVEPAAASGLSIPVVQSIYRRRRL